MPASQCVASCLDLHASHPCDLLQAAVITEAEEIRDFHWQERERGEELDTDEGVFVRRLRHDVELLMFSRSKGDGML